MKNYRKCIADAYAMTELLEHLATRADDLKENANNYRERMKEEDAPSYYEEEAIELEAKSEAFERLLAKLAK